MSTSAQVMELFNIFSKTYSKEEAQVIVKDIEQIIDSRKEDLATKGDIQKVNSKLVEIEFKLTKEIEAVKLEVEKVRSNLIKWVVSLLIAQTSITVTLVVTLLK